MKLRTIILQLVVAVTVFSVFAQVYYPSGPYIINVPGPGIYYFPPATNSSSSSSGIDTNDPALLAWWEGNRSITNTSVNSDSVGIYLTDLSTNRIPIEANTSFYTFKSRTNDTGNLLRDSTNIASSANNWQGFMTNGSGNTVGVIKYTTNMWRATNSFAGIYTGQIQWFLPYDALFSFYIKRATNGVGNTNMQVMIPQDSGTFTALVYSNIYVDDDWRYYEFTNVTRITSGPYVGFRDTNLSGHAAVIIREPSLIPISNTNNYPWTQTFVGVDNNRAYPSKNNNRVFMRTIDSNGPLYTTNNWRHALPVTVYGVFYLPRLTANQCVWDMSESSTRTTAGSTNGVWGVSISKIRLTSKGQSITNNWNTNSWGVITAVMDGANSSLRVNTGTAVTGTIGSPTNSYAFVISDAANVFQSLPTIRAWACGEVAIRSGADSESKQLEIINYLLTKYAITP